MPAVLSGRSRPAGPAPRGEARLTAVGPPRAPGPLARVPTATALTTIVGLLCAIGLVMVGTASPVISMGLYGSPWYVLIRQILWMGLGAVAFTVFRRVDYHRWQALRLPLLVVSLLGLLLVLVPHLGVTAGGSSRWLGVGMFRVQPSEVMKLALAVFAADLLARRARRLGDTRSVIVPIVVVLAAAAGLVMLQPDMGTALVMCCIAFGVLFMGGVRIRPIMKVLGALAMLALIAGMAAPYRRDRLLSFLDPAAHHSGSGYQVWESLIGLGTGNVFGVGLAGGREKWGLLPNAHTDFIFSVVGEELGLLGAVLLLGLFLAFAWYGIRAALRAPDRFGSLLAVAVTTWVTAQALINIGAVVGLLPVTGIPLPFISFGGSSLVIILAATGILVNVAGRERRSRARPSSAARRQPRSGPAGRPGARPRSA